MATYNIPEPFRLGFDEIFKLDDEKLIEIVDIIKNLPVGIGAKSFTQHLCFKFQIENIEQISRSIYSLGGLLISQEKESIDKLIKDLGASYNHLKESQISEDDIRRFENKLKIIFSGTDNLFLSFKALNLMNENDKIYLESRIISDIRLVFNKDLGEQRKYAVLIHNLKFEFQKDSSRKEFYISLDHFDLQKLKEVIERALEKEKLIKNDYKDLTEFIEITD